MSESSARSDERYMRECLRLALKGRGAVSPNPMVGAVLVKGNRIVSRGYHHRFGGPHAEVDCLKRYKGNPRGATMYVNLEPCSHFGKTPPCSARLIESGVSRVVVAMVDPNPLVSGRGIAALRRGRIDVTVGVLVSEARELNRMFVRHIRTGRPFVHLKIAQTLDGKIAGDNGRRIWISSIESRKLVHQWRSWHDAILVGAGTVLTDDPALTVRLVPGRDPDVIVLDGRFRVPEDAKIFKGKGTRRVFLIADQRALGTHKKKQARLASRGVTVLGIPGWDYRLPLRPVLRSLYRLNVGSILVEGGAKVYSEFLHSGLVDQLSTFMAPRTMRGGVALLDSRRGIQRRERPPARVEFRKIGKDILIQATLEEKE